MIDLTHAGFSGRLTQAAHAILDISADKMFAMGDATFDFVRDVCKAAGLQFVQKVHVSFFVLRGLELFCCLLHRLATHLCSCVTVPI
jgi:hypothetical protein